MSPMKIIAIFDNGGSTFDRYTVITNDIRGKFNNMLSTSEDPESYNGLSQWSSSPYDDSAPDVRLGKRIYFENLSTRLQRHIALTIWG